MQGKFIHSGKVMFGRSLNSKGIKKNNRRLAGKYGRPLKTSCQRFFSFHSLSFCILMPKETIYPSVPAFFFKAKAFFHTSLGLTFPTRLNHYDVYIFLAQYSGYTSPKG